MKDWQLEPEFRDAYQAWSADTGAPATAALLQQVTPLLRGAARRQLGDDGPLSLSSARSAFLDVLPRYDPKRARLSTFVYQQLQGLRRPSQRAARGIDVPDRVAADRYRIDTARRAFADEYGREPSDAEVMDYARVSPARFRRAQVYRPAVAQSAFTDDAPSATITPSGGSASDLTADLVYDSLSASDQQIMDLAFGRNGRRPLSNQEIAQKMRRTPGAISQRKARIQALLDEMAGTSLLGGG